MNMLKLSYIRQLFLLYFFVFLFFYFSRNEYFPAWYDACMQLFMLFLGYIVIVFSLKNNVSQRLFWSVIIYQLLCSALLISINWENYGEIYGYNPIDAIFYRNYAISFKQLSFVEAISRLKFDGNKLDDFGYPLILFLATKVSGDYFPYCIVIFNALIVGVGSLYLYKLSALFLPRNYSTLTAIFWGIMPFAVNTTAKGLKENFFVCFVILSIYCLYRYLFNKNYFYLFLFGLFTFFVFLFRLVVGYALILSFLAYIIYNFKIVRVRYKMFLTLSILVIISSFGVLADYVIDQRGYEYEVLAAHADEKIGGIIGTLTNFTAGFIGPIPNFVSSSPEKLPYITRYSFTPFFKMLISFYFWYAVYDIIKNKNTIFFPMIVLYVVNIVMLIFTFFTLHDRYQWPHIPIFIFLSAYGYMKSLQAKNVNKWYSFYLGGVLLIIFIYNFR